MVLLLSFYKTGIKYPTKFEMPFNKETESFWLWSSNFGKTRPTKHNYKFVSILLLLVPDEV